MSLIGAVVRMDVDDDGPASGAFLRGRVAIEIDKPMKRGVLLRMNRSEEPRWFQAQYEKLPYYCFACGVIGHSEMECEHPVARNEHEKLPYDVQLRAPKERRRRIQSFAGAAAESFGSGSSSASRPPRSHLSKSGGSGSSMGDDVSRNSSDFVGETEEQEVQSPLKHQTRGDRQERVPAGRVSKNLNMAIDEFGRQPRKRKSKGSGPALHTPDLNEPVASNAIVPAGLVNSRVNQLDTGTESSSGSLDENLKKQRRGSLTDNA